MSKKIISVALVLVLVLSIASVGCQTMGGGKPKTTDDTPHQCH